MEDPASTSFLDLKAEVEKKVFTFQTFQIYEDFTWGEFVEYLSLT